MRPFEEKIGKFPWTELAKYSYMVRAEDIVMYSRILLEQLGKEKAIELVKKARRNARYGIGRDGAEKLGNPREVNTFHNWRMKFMEKIPFVPRSEIVEESKNRVISRTTKCFLSDAILNLKLDADLMDVVRAYCNHEEGLAGGWGMKCTKQKFFLNGDKCCEFMWEAEEP
jgi:hypothetical protein